MSEFAASPVQGRLAGVKRLVKATGLPAAVRATVGFTRDVLVGLSGRAALTSTLYYAVFPAFRREHFGVARGIAKYNRALETPRASNPRLRRNIHRLEKGLCMRPLRKIFAEAFIEETVTDYDWCLKHHAVASADEGEVAWAFDVLSAYFDTVGSSSVIDRARKHFSSLPRHAHAMGKQVPFARDLDSALPFTLDQMEAMAVRRRSARWFKPVAVPRDILDRAALVAGMSPSACNRQPYEFRIFDDPKLVAQVARLPGGTGGFAEQIPVMVVVVGSLSNYFDERDRHLIYIDGSLAAMSFIYALEAAGLSSCAINWSDVPARESRMARLLSLEPDERVVMCIGVGYPDQERLVPKSTKKSLSLVRRYNFE